jgi:hypothetical protein
MDKHWKLICALSAYQQKNYLSYKPETGGCQANEFEQEEAILFFSELTNIIKIDELIDKRNFYYTMSDDAKMIIEFLCYGDEKTIIKYCSSPKTSKISKNKIREFYRKKWGIKRARAAIKEICNYFSL